MHSLVSQKRASQWLYRNYKASYKIKVGALPTEVLTSFHHAGLFLSPGSKCLESQPVSRTRLALCGLYLLNSHMDARTANMGGQQCRLGTKRILKTPPLNCIEKARRPPLACVPCPWAKPSLDTSTSCYYTHLVFSAPRVTVPPACGEEELGPNIPWTSLVSFSFKKPEDSARPVVARYL